MSLCALIDGLDRDRFAPSVVFSKDGPLLERLEQSGVPSRVLARRGFLGTGLIREAYGYIKRERIDLVHLNCAVPFSKYVGIAARLAGLPVIWHIREDTGSRKFMRLRRWVRYLPDLVVAVSSEQLSQLSMPGKSVMIPNGVDLGRFNPERDGTVFRDTYGIPPDAKVFGMVGTIEERKRPLDFLKAAGGILAGHPEARFVLVGNGLPEEVARVKGYLDSNPELGGRTVLTGRIEDVPGALAGIDYVVMASTWEGFPRAIIEAMAAGRPCIASSVGEVPYIIKDGVEGFIFTPGDTGTLQKRMESLIEDEGLARGMGIAAREKAMEYDIGRHAATVMEEYDKVLGAAGKAR